MLVRPVGPNVAAYYIRQGPGTWIGSGGAGLGLEGEVTRAELGAVLRGRDPASGRFLPEFRPARRRAGWDLVFTAPKSLSLVAASQAGLGERIADAQRAAVAESVSHFETALLHLRRPGAPGGRAPSPGAIAAGFHHAVNAGGEPHLHTHVLLVNLASDRNGRWSPLGGWWLERRELEAVYALGLRQHLAERGIDLDWRVRPDGLVDVAGVPRAAVRAASTRSHEAAAGQRHSGRSSDPGRPWRERAGAAGWDAAGHVATATGAAGRDASGLSAAVTTRLALKGSGFGRRDVLVALGSLPEARFSAAGAREWVDRFVSRCTPVHSAGRPMWTSQLAESADRRLEELLRDRIGRPQEPNRATSPPRLADPGEEIRACAEQVAGGPAVVVLGCDARRSGFLSHTAVISECARVWEPAGMTVAVTARSPIDSLRWKALTGIDEFRPSRRPDVLIVDQADRRPSAELAVLLGAAGEAKVVLVEGGTSLRPAQPASLVLDRLRDVLPRVDTDRVSRTLSWDVGSADRDHPAVALLGRWAECRLHAGGPPILVGLGVPETQALNDAARRHLAALRNLTGPELNVSGRSFRAGDTVIAVRPLGNGLPAGTLGAVTAVDPARSAAWISWPHRDVTAGPAALARIGHGYAATPRLASRTGARALVLGPPEGVGLERARVLEAFSARALEGPARSREGPGVYGPETWPVHR